MTTGRRVVPALPLAATAPDRPLDLASRSEDEIALRKSGKSPSASPVTGC